ncbi:hypothetical protein M409DRAFT_24722 [Zasmidium cellare ATCC 36951]|uniref:Apple domain-containing protein n=1 Tax=Zasmidium cellare ATCC 36951 TaxID=1080233 RepID=A0A6A6CC92_ZASCE|nr:uncharacterized protein M409DRAFT_24722 [Zasmidium cellare ATCC 36951]KAF2164817.1 hypothetical protein M409DRAFT_24722 [Zasmidium cellare ATCC 36951]
MLLLNILGLVGAALAATTTTCQTVSTSTSTSRVKTYWNTETTTETKSIKSVYQDTITTTQPDKTVTSQNTIYTLVGTTTVGGGLVSAGSTTTSTSQIWTTVTATTSTVSTFTSTISYPTSTISPSPGFTPLADYLNSQGHVATRIKSAARKRNVAFEDAGVIENRQASQYPVFVLCDKYIGTTTSTTVTSTKTPPKTSTLSRSTTTVTAADATKKVKSTVSAGATTTYTATSTYYAACAANNSVDTVDGGAIESFSPYTPGLGFSLYQGVPAPQTAYECCVACLMMDPPCALSWWTTNPTPGCLLLADNGTCTGSGFQAWFKTTPGDESDTTFSNSNCASWDYLGTT